MWHAWWGMKHQEKPCTRGTCSLFAAHAYPIVQVLLFGDYLNMLLILCRIALQILEALCCIFMLKHPSAYSASVEYILNSSKEKNNKCLKNYETPMNNTS